MTKREKIAEINAKLTADIAAVKAQKEQTIADYCAKVAELHRHACEAKNAAADDPEDSSQDNEQPAQWLNGEQWSCAVVARRILNRLPNLNSPKESFYIEISPSYLGGCDLNFRYINTIVKDSGIVSCDLTSRDEPEVQAANMDLWFKRVEVEMLKAKAIMDNEREEAGNE